MRRRKARLRVTWVISKRARSRIVEAKKFILSIPRRARSRIVEAKRFILSILRRARSRIVEAKIFILSIPSCQGKNEHSTRSILCDKSAQARGALDRLILQLKWDYLFLGLGGINDTGGVTDEVRPRLWSGSVSGFVPDTVAECLGTGKE